MKEEILRKYFSGEIGVDSLRNDLNGAIFTENGVTHHIIEEMQNEYEVTAKHLIKLCDDVLGCNLEATSLQPIAFCLLASNYFQWDVERDDISLILSDIIYEWSAPEINFPLTLENVKQYRKRLYKMPSS